MRLLNWIISKLISDKNNSIIELRKEIEKLKKIRAYERKRY